MTHYFEDKRTLVREVIACQAGRGFRGGCEFGSLLLVQTLRRAAARLTAGRGRPSGDLRGRASGY